MGNDLEKEYNIKQKPIKLPGSYSFLKFVDHPTDTESSLVIVKEPHKAGVIASNILLPIKEVKNLGHSQYSVARCKKCIPLSLFKPRSQIQMKLILWSIIKSSTELGRIFVCNGRLMLWCEETRSFCSKSPEQLQGGKQTQKSKVFASGLCLINYLSCVYQKESKKKKSKPKVEVQAFFNPKDKKEYFEFVSNLEIKLNKSNFWEQISDGMKGLIMAMLAKQPSERIDMETLLQLPYFASQKQLKLYHVLAQQLSDFQQKQTIMFMETLQMVLKNRVIIDDLILQSYFIPVLVLMLERKPDMILSALIQVPNSPIKAVYWCLKKGNPKNLRLVSIVLRKRQKLLQILNEQMYDAGMSRMIFSSYESQVLLERAIHATPFLMRTIKQANYRKQIQFLLVHKILENYNISHNILLLALKCAILMIQENLFTNITKLYGLNYNPLNYEEQLQINLHILHLYSLLIDHIEPSQLITVLIPKLQPYLSNDNVTDELFFQAKACVNEIMQRLTKVRNINEQDVMKVDYQKSFFEMPIMPKPSEQEVIAVLRKQVSKSKNKNIQWLDGILENEHLIDL